MTVASPDDPRGSVYSWLTRRTRRTSRREVVIHGYSLSREPSGRVAVINGYNLERHVRIFRSGSRGQSVLGTDEIHQKAPPVKATSA